MKAEEIATWADLERYYRIHGWTECARNIDEIRKCGGTLENIRQRFIFYEARRSNGLSKINSKHG